MKIIRNVYHVETVYKTFSLKLPNKNFLTFGLMCGDGRFNALNFAYARDHLHLQFPEFWKVKDWVHMCPVHPSDTEATQVQPWWTEKRLKEAFIFEDLTIRYRIYDGSLGDYDPADWGIYAKIKNTRKSLSFTQYKNLWLKTKNRATTLRELNKNGVDVFVQVDFGHKSEFVYNTNDLVEMYKDYQNKYGYGRYALQIKFNDKHGFLNRI